VAPGTSGFDAAILALSASSVVGSLPSSDVSFAGFHFNVILHFS
jgi:hypothetical protein